jgi:hypothetical protein
MSFAPTLPSLLGLASLLILGALTSWEDLRRGLIRNQWVAAGLLAALFVQALDGWGSPYGLTALLAVLFALAVGAFVWWAGFWTAGDAKLFAAFVALVPLSAYGPGVSLFTPAYALLLYTFLPAFLVFALKALWDSDRAEVVRAIRRALQPASLGGLALSLFAFVWVAELAFRFAGIAPNYLAFLLAVFFLIQALEAVLPPRAMTALPLALSALRLLLDAGTVLSPAFWQFFALQFASLVVLMFFFSELGQDAFAYALPLARLRAGLMPAEGVIPAPGGRYRKIPLKARYSLSPVSLAGLVVPSEGWWLSEKDLRFLREQAKRGRLSFRELEVQQTLPFAPFLTLGALLLLFLGVPRWLA